MSRVCPGCGAALQSEQPDKPGFIPAAYLDTGGSAVCRRCYRLIHYGRADGASLAPDKARQQINRALAPAETVVVVAELSDFEGGLPPEGMLPADKQVILAVNKLDLLPPKSAAGEIEAWAQARWRASGRPAAKCVVGISAAKGKGLAELVAAMRRYRGHHHVAAIIGATSVGKSTLLGRLLAEAGAKEKPTVSRLPGTTQAASRWYLEDIDLTLYDTPGFIPGDRLTDRLCPACAANLVPERAMGSKLFGMEPGQALVMAGYAAFILEGDAPRTFLAYGGERLHLHRTKADKAGELLRAKPDWLLPWACPACRGLTDLRETVLSMAAGEDAAVAGLGWISLRGGPAMVRVLLPDGVRLSQRPAMFAAKNAVGKSPNRSRPSRTKA